MKVIRFILGRIILLFSFLTPPRKGKRGAEKQAQVEQQLASYSLYQFHACPFCVKVRRQLRRLNLPMELRDAKAEGQHRTALLEQGGRIKVPCLRIDNADGTSQWLYESSDINAYLQQTFAL